MKKSHCDTAVISLAEPISTFLNGALGHLWMGFRQTFLQISGRSLVRSL